MMELQSKIAALRALPSPDRRRTLREAAGLSQDDVAQGFTPPVTRAAVSRWESGSRTPRGYRLAQYVAILDLLAGEGS